MLETTRSLSGRLRTAAARGLPARGSVAQLQAQVSELAAALSDIREELREQRHLSRRLAEGLAAAPTGEGRERLRRVVVHLTPLRVDAGNTSDAADPIRRALAASLARHQQRVPAAQFERLLTVLHDSLALLAGEGLEIFLDAKRGALAGARVTGSALAFEFEFGERPPMPEPFKLKPSEQQLEREELAEAQRQGEAARLDWVRSGEIVPAKVLAEYWGLTPQALSAAQRRGELRALLVKRQRYYPREFLQLERDAVAAVTRALGGLSPEEQLIFWTREHGELEGLTAPAYLGRCRRGRAYALEKVVSTPVEF